MFIVFKLLKKKILMMSRALPWHVFAVCSVDKKGHALQGLTNMGSNSYLVLPTARPGALYLTLFTTALQ